MPMPWEINWAAKEKEAAVASQPPVPVENKESGKKPWEINWIERFFGEKKSSPMPQKQPMLNDRELGNGLVLPSPGEGVRNLRNNNPGNIRWLEAKNGISFAESQGAIGKDKDGFAIFPDKATGSRAMDALLMRYNKDGLDTVSKIINKWAPESDNNNPKTYAKNVANRLGVDPNDKLDFNNTDLLRRLSKEMSRFEGSVDAYHSPK